MDANGNLVRRLGAHAWGRPAQAAIWGDVGGEWRRLTWALYDSSVRQAARGLLALRLRPGEVVAVVSANRPELGVVHLGVAAAGGLAAPLDPSLPDGSLARCLRTSGAVIAVCDSARQVERVAGLARRQGIALEHLVVLDAATVRDPRVLTLDALMEQGAGVRDAAVDDRLASVGADSPVVRLAGAAETLELTHGELHRRGEALAGRLALEASPRILPLAPMHSVAGLTVGLALPLVTGGEAWFGSAGRPLAERFAAARPTVVLGDRASWGDLAEAVEARLAALAGPRRHLLGWLRPDDRTGADGLGRRLARRLVVDEVRAAIGFDDVEAALTIEPVAARALEQLTAMGLVVRPLE